MNHTLTAAEIAFKTSRLTVGVVLVADGISAYDQEAAQRYARETLEESREHIANSIVDLGFADGELHDATFTLPERLEPHAMVTDGEEGDPHGNMEHAEFEIETPASIVLEFEHSAMATSQQIIGAAKALLATCKAVKGVAFDDDGMGSELRLANPLAVELEDPTF